MDNHLAGGLRADETTGYIRIEKQALDKTDTITLHVVGLDLFGVTDLKIEDLDEMAKVEEYSRTYHKHLKPAYSTTNWRDDS